MFHWRFKNPIPPLILAIDRSQPFNTKGTFPGLTIWLGEAEGKGLKGDHDQDPRSLALATVDFSIAQFKHPLIGEEPYVDGEVSLTRAKDRGEIRLDPRIGEALWLDYLAKKEESVLEGVFLKHKVTWFELLTPLLDSKGYRCALSFYRIDNGWYWSYYWPSLNRDASSPSVSLAS